MTQEQFDALDRWICDNINRSDTLRESYLKARALFVTDKFVLTCIAGAKHFVLSGIDDEGKFEWLECQQVMDEEIFPRAVQVSKIEAAMFIGILTAAEPRDHFGMVKVP